MSAIRVKSQIKGDIHEDGSFDVHFEGVYLTDEYETIEVDNNVVYLKCEKSGREFISTTDNIEFL